MQTMDERARTVSPNPPAMNPRLRQQALNKHSSEGVITLLHSTLL